MDLTISLVNWNTRDDLREALKAIFASESKLDYEVIVVDNDSHDGSAEMVECEFPNVVLIRSGKNLGYGAGHNRAFEIGKGRYRMPLNPDSLVTPGFFDKLIAFADQRPEAGVIGPKILYPNGDLQYSCRRFPSVGAALFRNALFDKLFPSNKLASDYLMRDFDHQQVKAVDWVSGAALLIRAELLQKIKGFDEAFFMYCEDTDLCKRAQLAGYQTLYFPDAIVYHAIGRATDAAANKMTLQHHKSMYLYYQKYTANETPLLLRPLVPLGLWARALATVLRNSWNLFKRRLKRSKRGAS